MYKGRTVLINKAACVVQKPFDEMLCFAVTITQEANYNVAGLL